MTRLITPAMLHAAVVHMPIALSIVGFCLIIVCGIFEESRTLRFITVVTFAALFASSWYGVQTGEHSRDLVPNTLPGNVWDIITAHEEMAERVVVAALVTLVFAALSLIRHREFAKGMLLVSGLGSFVTVLLVSTTAHYGGTLVYTYGVGTAYMHQTPNATVAVPPGPASTGDPAATPPAPAPAPAPEEELVPIRDIDPAAAQQVDFQRDVLPIIEKSCLDCHDADEPDGKYDMSTIEGMMKAGEKAGPGVIPGDPDKSAVVQYIRGEMKPRMPHKEPPLDAEDLHTIRMWISAGAKAPATQPTEAAPAEEAPAEPFDPFA